MKILIASDTYYPNVNGASYFTYRLATGLIQSGHEVTVIFPSQTSRRTKILHEGVTVYGVPSFKLPTIKPAFRVSPAALAKRSIVKIVDEVKPDVIHIQNHFMIGKAITQIALRRRIPIIGTNHFMPENLIHYFHIPKQVEQKILHWGWNQFLKVFEKMDFITTPTQTALGLLKKIGFSREVMVVSNGIDLQKFRPENNGEYLRKMYRLPKDKPILLYTGRLEKEKKIEQIINAIPFILKKIPVHLVIAGDGNLRQKLVKLSLKLNLDDVVTFTGFVKDEDFPKLYSIADIFIIAGIAELQSIVTMEAMATGLPIVAVNAMALPELVHDGENGFLFNPGDSKKIAKNVITILSDKKLYGSMSKASLRIIQKHDIRRTISIFESIYRETIKKHRSTDCADGRKIKTKSSRKDLAIGFTIFAIFLVGIFGLAAGARAQNREVIEQKIQTVVHSAVSKSTVNYNHVKARINSKFDQDMN